MTWLDARLCSTQYVVSSPPALTDPQVQQGVVTVWPNGQSTLFCAHFGRAGSVPHACRITRSSFWEPHSIEPIIFHQSERSQGARNIAITTSSHSRPRSPSPTESFWAVGLFLLIEQTQTNTQERPEQTFQSQTIEVVLLLWCLLLFWLRSLCLLWPAWPRLPLSSRSRRPCRPSCSSLHRCPLMTKQWLILRI